MTALLLAAFISPVAAADLPVRSASVQPPILTPAYNWTGFYVGLNAGYSSGEQTPLSMFSGNFEGFDYSSSGWLGGLTAGAQIQSGHVVLGLESDIAWTNITGSGSGPVSLLNVPIGTATISSKLSSISTVRTRFGYAAENWLFYGTGGVAITNEKSTVVTSSFVCNGPGVLSCASRDDYHLGLAAGGGVEYGMTPNLTTKLEYLWVGASAGNTLKTNIVRAGINYRFGN